MKNINFIFNDIDFSVDYLNLSEEEIVSLNNKKYEIVYNLAFEEEIIEFKSTQYLQLISKRLIQLILNISELEIVREKINLDFQQVNVEKIIDRVKTFIK